jgi:hypothetical protein
MKPGAMVFVTGSFFYSFGQLRQAVLLVAMLQFLLTLAANQQ